jgi:membrane protease YdiL (CAAX protease family)
LLLVLAAFFLGIVAGGILGGIGVLLDGGDTKGPGLLIGSFIGQWVVWVGAAVLASRRFGTGSLRRDVDWRIDKSDVLLGLGVAVAGLLATILVQQVLSAISKDFVGSNTSFVEDQAGTAIGSVIVGLSTMIGAPIVEELFFRGLLQHSLARFRVAAVVVQGLVFGLVHVTPGEGLGNVGIVAGLATFGMVLGFSVRQTRRLGTSMVAHGIFNAIAVIPILLR